MEIETPTAPVQSSDASVGDIFSSALKETMNPSQVQTPAIVEEVKTPEAPKLETPKVAEVAKPAEPSGKKPEELSKWKELKAASDQLKELTPKLSEYEKKALEAEKRAAEYEAKYKAIEDEKKGYETELTENRTWRMAFDLENTPEYYNAVTKPFEDASGAIQALATKFEIDPSEMLKVATEVDDIARARGLFALIRDHEEGPAVQKLLEKQIDKLDKARDAHMEQVKHSEGLQNQINARRSQQEQEKTVQQREDEHKARTESWGLLKSTLALPEVFDSKDPSITAALEEIQKAELEDTPMARAIAARAVPMVGLLGKMFREETARLKADLAARDQTIADISGSRPGAFRPSSPAAVKSNESAADALGKAMASMGMRG
jgi:hypothetical protein